MPEAKIGGIGDAAVQQATGKTWKQWFALLDKAGARKMDHKAIVAHIGRHYPEVGGWWIQMVTVGYEQARGMRDKHQKPGGYEISASKTVAAPVETLFAAWHDERVRRKWLAGARLTIRKATPHKSMRITWEADSTSVSVNFYPKGDGKSEVALQHGKLPDATTAEQIKAYWAERLDRLKEVLKKHLATI